MKKDIEVTVENITNIVHGTLLYVQHQIDTGNNTGVITCFLFPKCNKDCPVGYILAEYDSSTERIRITLDWIPSKLEYSGRIPSVIRVDKDDPIISLSYADEIMFEFYPLLRAVVRKFTTNNMVIACSDYIDLNAKYAIAV